MAAMIRSTLFRNVSPHTRILDGKYVQHHFSYVGRSKFTSTKSLYQESMTADGDTAMKHTNSTGDKQHSLDLSFCNAKEAYRSKTTGEIARGLFVFNMCSIPFLVNHNKTVRARCCIIFCRCCALACCYCNVKCIIIVSIFHSLIDDHRCVKNTFHSIINYTLLNLTLNWN